MSALSEKLDSVTNRYNELNRLMGDPDVAADYNRLNELARERTEIEELVQVYSRYKEVEEQISDNRELMDEDDPEIQELAELENEELEAERDSLEEELKLLLLPKDPDDRRERYRRGAGWYRRRRSGSICRRAASHVFTLGRRPRFEAGDTQQQ